MKRVAIVVAIILALPAIMGDAADGPSCNCGGGGGPNGEEGEGE